MKDPGALKRKQQRQEELEKKAADTPDDGKGLQVSHSRGRLAGVELSSTCVLAEGLGGLIWLSHCHLHANCAVNL